MKNEFDEDLPEEIEAVVSRLRRERAELDPLRMDQLKQRVMIRAQSQRRVGFMRQRISTAMTLLALVAGGGGAIAIAANSASDNSGNNSANGEYNGNGKKCGIAPNPDCPPQSNGNKGKHFSSQTTTVALLKSNLAD